MGKIVMSEFVSLDGVKQDPDGNEGFRVGGWVGQIKDREELTRVKVDEALSAEALLLGRRSYEFFAARWQPRRGELADRLNSLPKYVVSSTLQDPDWNNTTVLKGEVVNAVSKLKQQLSGDIVVYASFHLMYTLLEHDLVDELRLVVYPVVLGAGDASSARPATRSPCGWSTPGPSTTTSPSSPMSPSETPNARSGSHLRFTLPGLPTSGTRAKHAAPHLEHHHALAERLVLDCSRQGGTQLDHVVARHRHEVCGLV